MYRVYWFRDWIKNNKLEAVLLFVILLIGFFMRFWRIGGYMTFLGDEGRDAIIVRRLLVDFDPILIGPGTSIGNMYLGPLYYYLIAPSLFLANLSPIGPSVFVALVGIATIFVVWLVVRDWFPPKEGSVAWGALIASFLYSIAPTVIIYSRSSWNPNVMPFFALISVWGVWKVWQDSNYKWMVAAAASFAFALQSHYLGLLLAPVLGIFWLGGWFNSRGGDTGMKFVRYSLASVFVFGFLMSPLLLFDIRHGWMNFNAMKQFFLVRQTTVSARPWSAIPQMWPLLSEVSARLIAGRDELVGTWVAVTMVGATAWIMGSKKYSFDKRTMCAFVVLIVWLGVALLGLGLYKQHVYDHYFGFFFAAPFLLIGGIVQFVLDRHKIRGWWLIGTGVVVLTYYNLIESPIKGPPNRQLQRTREVAEKIRNEAGGEKFNLAVIAERNYEDAYQYFLEKWRTGVTDIDPLNYDATVKDQLFVVCEMEEAKCDPTHSAKAEVANFGWSEIDEQWTVSGVLVYKLVHTKI